MGKSLGWALIDWLSPPLERVVGLLPSDAVKGSLCPSLSPFSFQRERVPPPPFFLGSPPFYIRLFSSFKFTCKTHPFFGVQTCPVNPYSSMVWDRWESYRVWSRAWTCQIQGLILWCWLFFPYPVPELSFLPSPGISWGAEQEVVLGNGSPRRGP